MMKRCFLFLILLSVYAPVIAQYYYKCIGVYDNKLNPFPEKSSQYTAHYNTYMMLNYVEGGITYKFHNTVGAAFLSYAGKDYNTGNTFYANVFMGQPQLQDMFGNYFFVQFENGTQKILVAAGGILKECVPVKEKEYFDYVRMMGVAPGLEQHYSSGGNYNNNTTGSSSKSSTYYVECHSCHGKGYSMTKKYAPNYGGGTQNEKCNICNDFGRAHYHEPCKICHGKGQLKRSSY